MMVPGSCAWFLRTNESEGFGLMLADQDGSVASFAKCTPGANRNASARPIEDSEKSEPDGKTRVALLRELGVTESKTGQTGP